jgi:hypothetical protein
MKKIRAILALLLLVALGTSAGAENPLLGTGNPPHGIGAYACKEILALLVPAIEQNDARTVNEIAIAMRQWTVGYAVAIQITRDIVVLDGMNQKTIDKMLFEGCAAHPELKLGRVVTNWMTERAQALAKQKNAQ